MELLTRDNLPLQIPLDGIYPSVSVMEELHVPLNSFIGLPEYFSYCTVQDPARTDRPKLFRGGYTTLWTIYGRVTVSTDIYMDHMETCKPDMYVSLSDGETNPESGYKRTHSSAAFTSEMFKRCLEKHQSSSVLKNKGLIAPLVGGYDPSLREECAKFMADFPVLGYSIDGLYTDFKTVPSVCHKTIENILSYSLPHLPVEQLRIIHGPWEPELVLKMIKLGIDLFDTTFPHIAADNGDALIFNYNVSNFDSGLYDYAQNYKDITKNEVLEDLKYDEKHENFSENTRNLLLKNPYTISLYSKKYFDDFSTLFEGCDCLTCRKHTKSYIHHLLTTKELLGPVLLTIHNLHHYVKFFQKIRENLHRSSSDTPD